MRAANLMTGILNLAGMAGAILGLSPAITELVAEQFGQPAAVVYAAALAVAAAVNGLMAGSFLAPAVFGRDDDQYLA